ncbi:TipAS antibiotic-recognition domain-containing protein [Streptomyces sp. NBC_00233]|uniref:telomere-associated protein Tap n=1 Tax=Streptomyces sp. NBC_00233 TaxID=2975686 RepID=UPI00225697C5|nr:TipAS antibiotic-recognition domain-containing protein [Streptomyces sp. NBC_00233]MCX5232959.1 TipAS antibiotic-recognition domain-containing protein [Streptomyces sp. NBC_00233]
MAKKAAPVGTPPASADPRFVNGPLALVDVDAEGQVLACCTGGLVLDVPAKSLPSLVEWTLKEARLGQPKLSGPGKEADPLLVLTETALERYGLPTTLTDEERLAGRIPENHKAVKQLLRAEWKLTKRGLGPWARIYRPAQGSERACVQLCIPSWNALDTRHWGEAGDLPPVELARVLGVYASRVMTPRGSMAVTGLELMTALHPPTRASEPDTVGKRHSEHNPGSLGKDPVDPAPCEAPDGHPVLVDLPRFHVRGPGEKLFEEAYDWARPMTDAECTVRHLVGIDVNLAFGAGANGLTVGLGAPTHVKDPVFDPKLPGSWLVDLSHVDLSKVKAGKEWVQLDGSLLPSPFTPKGETPTGPAWYATPTVAYAVELGYEVTASEAYVRYDNGRYLDSWYTRLRDAYLATMTDLGVGPDLPPEDFLTAMDGYKDRDPQLGLVVSARVVVYREIGLGLDRIQAVLDDAGTDVPAALRTQRAQVAERVERLQRLGAGLDRMIEAHERGLLLTVEQQAAIFGPDWDPEGPVKARQRYGDTLQWRQYAERSAARTPEEWQAVHDAVAALDGELASALDAGVAPGSPEANALVDRHRAVFTAYFPLTREMQVCLARTYASDPGFAAHYDGVRPGLAAWFRTVVDASARAHGIDPDAAAWR